MAKKRIIAHFMHESELAFALPLMKKGDVTESYLVGEVDENDIPRLQKEGLIVQVLEEKPEAETAGAESQPAPGVRRRSFRMEPVKKRKKPPISKTKPNYYLIGLKGPLLEDWREKLDKCGVRLMEYVSHYHYTARLTPTKVEKVRKLSFVRTVRIYGPEDTGPVALTRTVTPPPAVPAPGTGRSMLTYDVRLHREEDLEKVRTWLQKRGVSIAGTSKRKIRLYLLEGSPLADEIAALPQVASIEEYVPPKLFNDIARTLLGIDRPEPNPGDNIPQSGNGQIVAVADTGLDESHPDFQGRIVGIVALGRTNDASDPHGHGTHVAGSVLGDGTSSGGTIRGAAPKAKLFFQSLLDASGGLGGLPLNLGDLFEEAYQAGARIHNNSWGAATRSMYTINSIEVDEFVAQRRDMLVVIAAGNEGQAADRLHSRPGFVDWLSVGSPSTSKNALCIGASRSSRNSGGYAQFTYGQAWPDNFPDPPIADENISGDPEGLAAFSSRGPCDDRRIKPDIVAPGTDIVSAKSSRAPLRNFWGPYPGGGSYAYMGGTSMATPLVSGCAALVREYFVADRNHEPSAALLKATIINGTRWLTGSDAIADHPSLPNFHQGFGFVKMPWTIPNPSMPNLKLEFLDTMKEPAKQFFRTGQRFRYQFSIAGGSWLRICLTWTDVPARSLQNNLNLFVQNLQTGQKWMGNEDLPMRLMIPDPDNNVEVVRLDGPPAGDYLIQVSATNLLQSPQDFALVVTGDLTSSFTEI